MGGARLSGAVLARGAWLSCGVVACGARLSGAVLARGVGFGSDTLAQVLYTSHVRTHVIECYFLIILFKCFNDSKYLSHI